MSIAGFKNYVVIFCTVSLLHFIFSAVVLAQNLNMFPTKTNHHPNMSSYLEKLEREYKEGAGAQRMVTHGLNNSSHDPDKVTVYLMSAPGIRIDEDALDNLGAQIIKQAENVIKAKVSIDLLTAVADNVEGVSFMKTPDKLIPVAVTSEGVSLTGADTYHNAGYDGSGVKVAVFDVGFIGLSNAISNNELPNNVVKVDCTVQPCNSNNPSIENDSNHGTAVAEIVHDMAPGASLYLIKVSDDLDLEDAKDFVVNNGIRIINMALVVPNTNFYDGECWSLSGFSNPVCTANDAYANNILWVNAAGNEAQRHYEAVFTDSDTDGWHNVSGSSEAISISANAGDTIEVYLTWDAWPTTNQDYDLYLYNASDTLVDSSSNSQTGSQPPIETIVYSVPVNGTYYLRIRQESATSNHSMEVYSIYRDLSPAVASSSLLGPADAAGVMAVGAIDYNNWTTGPQEPYSSQGPTNDGRIKPDIMGPDNVSNDVYGSGFTGTSASCAHVAGAAALILDKNPGFSVDQLWDSLISTAIDMGTPGKDNIFGYGRLRLDDNDSLPSVEDYQGTYSGTYTGDDNGTWSVSVAETGNGAAYSYSNLYNRPNVGLGSVEADGSFTLYMDGGAVINGTIAVDGSVTGSWTNDTEGGAIEGTLNSFDSLAELAGTYKGTYTGPDSGTWSATINDVGFVSGSSVSSSDGERISGEGNANTAGEIYAEMNNGTILYGVLNSDTKAIQGVWYNPILDMGGTLSGNLQVAPVATSDGGGGGGGCFVATAAYGSLMEPHVKILRDFRDRFLIVNSIGKGFVRIYYAYSPPIADFIAEHDNLRAMVRISLLPVVGVSWIALKIGPVSTMALMLFFAFCLIGLVRVRKKFNR